VDELGVRAWRRPTRGASTRARPLGRPAAQTVRALLTDAGEDTIAGAAAHQLALQYGDLVDVVAAEGADELLSVLARFSLPWAVVTSADRRLATARLGAAGLSTELLITSEDVNVGKPDPECYLLAADKLGVNPCRCLVVEDSEVGTRASEAAGAAVCAGHDGQGHDDDATPSSNAQYTATTSPSEPARLRRARRSSSQSPLRRAPSCRLLVGRRARPF
jgi:sugar-phosphatase